MRYIGTSIYPPAAASADGAVIFNTADRSHFQRVQDDCQEVILRGSSNDWAIKLTACRAEGVMVLEQFAADGLLAAHRTAEQAYEQTMP